ncbi:hypothetical protein [Bacillus sp. 1NLA3E]|uniref:hypothetical protein n=1 Tax=Bacillus sp. 1NLA3E TaxID=666686 RepID=UPI000247E6C3|nr:hypothetical protein [Bacillus sp. 1NLA3E]
MNLKAGNLEEFNPLSQFSTLENFLHDIEGWLFDHKHDFSKGELVGMKWLVHFSSKVPGVCNLPIGTILKAIHEDYYDHGISRSTFKKMLLKAKKLGIISVYETAKQNGSQSSNLYVFNRYPANETAKTNSNLKF